MNGGIGLNSGHANVDASRAFRWSICNSSLSPTASLICHTIGVLFDEDGCPVWPSIKWISEHSRIPVGTVKYYMREVREWRNICVEKARGRRPNTYRPNIDVAAVQAEYQAWEDYRKSVAGQADYSANRRRITEIENRPVAGQLNSVVGQPNYPLLHTKQQAAAASSRNSDSNDSTIVSLNDDGELIRRKLGPFGEHGHEWTRELAQFLRIDVAEAIERMERAARTYGHFNVIEAIREAVGTTNVKSPSGLFGSILSRQLREHGKRDEMPRPRETNGGTYRPLTMQERTFYC